MENVYEFEATATKHRIYPWFNAVADLVEEARINITDQGMYIKCVDPANVAMLIANISTDQFESFKTTADAENPLTLGIDFTRYTEIMKKKYIKNKSILSFEALPPLEIPINKEADFVPVHSKYLPRILFGANDIFFKYNTLGPSTIRKEPKVPALDLPIEMIIPCTELCNILNAMDTAGIDHMRIGVDFTDAKKPELTMYGETDADELVYRTIPTSDLPYFKHKVTNDYLNSDHKIGSLHSLDYLNPMIKSLKAFGGAGDVRVKLGQDFPISLSMDLEGKSKISYLLAPRIESD